MVGKTISHYKIIEEIGRGGMGMVYKAEDTKLNRTVALKFLPPELIHNQESKERFIREAHAASALEHDNICTIHEINETDDGQLFIVMACYEGQTLKKIISDQKLLVDQAINIATQIGKGLQKAHEKGIVHRDIKPANIFITDDGSVKILDFGLAKLAGKAQLTKDSSTLGTVVYMSPEQLRGEEVDHHTDIWSLGIVFYEMLTGEPPFKGDYEQAIVYSILNEELKPLINLSSAQTDFAKDINDIVNRALSKNLAERYHNIEQILDDLKSIQATSPLQLKRNKFSKSRVMAFFVALAVVIISAVITMDYMLTHLERETGFRITHTLPLTTSPGLELDPTWSPDGTRIAYTSNETGNMDIWMLQINAAQKINLTKNYMGYDGKPAWSPNGEWIAFVSERNGGGIFLISAVGGTAKRVVPLSFTPSLSYIHTMPIISWSPDGKDLVYTITGKMFKIPVNGGLPIQIPLPDPGLIAGYSEPAWSSNGERIACTDIAATGVSTSQIWTVRSNGSDPVALTDGKHFDYNPVWSTDGKQLFFISDRGGSRDVWWLPVDSHGYPKAKARPLTAGIGVGDIVLSYDGTKLIYTKMVERSNIWSIPLVRNRVLSFNEARMITSENQYIESLYISPDKEWIAFDSNRSGNTDIWIMRKDGSDLRQLTTNTANDWVGPWSPDGSMIAFHSLRHGNRDIFVMPVSGGTVKRLTNHPAEDFVLDWSPDGEKIAFSSNRSGNMDLWTVPSRGGQSQQLTFHQANEWVMRWSPDGKRYVFNSSRTGYEELFIKTTQGGKPLQLTHSEWLTLLPVFWSRDGNIIYAQGFGRQSTPGINLWAMSVFDGTARLVIDLKGSFKEPIAASSDGQRLYFTLWESAADLWMTELQKNIEN